jgi:hypothetical protein
MNIDFDRAKLERLKVRVKEAVEKDEQTFKFEGSEFMLSYAKYVIEYLESKLPK